MNYKKSIISSAVALGLTIGVQAQESKFSLNGYGRSLLTNNSLSGERVDNQDVQTKSISGYNLFDLQTNLAVDSVFQAKAILRTYSPFGAFFGAATRFEFRQFTMNGKLKNLSYELGDIRIEMTPYTVFNSNVYCSAYEADVFKGRREIQEYENFNDGNTWLLQGAAGQYAYKLGGEMGLGIYAFTTRTASTNELTSPDRLLSGGRLQFTLNKNIKFGINEVSMYDLAVATADFDYANNVITADMDYNRDMGSSVLDLRLEVGGSIYNYTDNTNKVDTAYNDMMVDLGVDLLLKNPKLKLNLDVRQVGAVFASPTAQTRRINPTLTPGVFGQIGTANRDQLLFDRFTAEDIYNNAITPNLMAFLPHYNNISPYGKATPNRFVVDFGLKTDTANKVLSAGVGVSYGTELIGEGGDAKRGFLVAKGGAVAHLGNQLGLNRLFDVNLGFRFENTSRTEGAKVDLTSTLVDFGVSGEVLKKLDVLVGLKYYMASGNEYNSVRDGFNLVTDFTEYEIDMNEMILSAGLRFRFNENQSFNMNYNLADMKDNLVAGGNYSLGQFFINYTGRF